jgi:hypothetical protein
MNKISLSTSKMDDAMSNKLSIFLLSLSFIFLVACGDGGGGGGGSPASPGTGTITPPATSAVSAPNIVLTGVFIDSPVEGLKYVSGDVSGDTDSDGTFEYEENSEVEFFVGSISLGKAQGSALLTPAGLTPATNNQGQTSTLQAPLAVNSDYDTNILRFLQSLDSDSSADNGITIDPGMHTRAQNQSLDLNVAPAAFETNALSMVRRITSDNRSLISANSAVAHHQRALSVETIEITPVNPTLTSGTAQQLQAIGRMANGTIVNLTMVATWSTSDSDIISLDSNRKGFARALARV